MKRYILLLFSLTCCLYLQAQQTRQFDDVQVGPWVTAVRAGNDGQASAKIVWTSLHDGMGWVELVDSTRVYDTFAGRHTFGRYHCVTLNGLTAGEPVRYRIGGQILCDDSDSVNPIFGETYFHPWECFKPFDALSDHCNFSMMNDIHMHTDSYRSLVSQIDSAETDFIFLCGDIISRGNYTLDTLVHYEIESLGTLSAGMPVQFARGNHEGRGNGIREVAKVYPQAEEADRGGEFYYTFRQGPIAFIVLDGGETGTDRSRIFCGEPIYYDYIDEQVTWAKRAVQKPSFKDAPFKVCFIHVPMVDHPVKDDYYLQRYLNKNVLPLLNEAGVNLMLGADLHEHMYCPAGTMGNDFPILVNSSEERLDFVYDGETVHIHCYDPMGKETHSLVLPTPSTDIIPMSTEEYLKDWYGDADPANCRPTDYFIDKVDEFDGQPRQEGCIVLLGDSITDFGDWSAYLPGVNLINRGIAGDKLEGMCLRLDEIASHRPSKVFLQGGANNLVKHSNANPESVIPLFKSLISRIRAKMPYAELYVQSMLPQNSISIDWSDHYNQDVEIINKALAEMASEYGYAFIDIATPMKDDKGSLRIDCTVDGCHLSDTGFKIWAAILAKII